MTEENKNVYYLNRLEPPLMQLKPRLNYLLYQMKRFDESPEIALAWVMAKALSFPRLSI